MEDFETKNSGDNVVYAGGTKRENKTGKVRYDLIPIPELRRVADLYTRGAEVYGERNWEGGDLEYAEKAKASAFRHFYQYMEGDRTEDHMAAVCWNLFTIEALTRMNYEKGNRGEYLLRGDCYIESPERIQTIFISV